MGVKGRPKKVRYIQKMPRIVQFSPRGRPGRPDEVELSLDQFEAIKLADHQGFSQEEGAYAMKISRASFGRILREARAKIADALVHGKIIKFRLGQVQVGVRKVEYNKVAIEEEVIKFKEQSLKAVKSAKLLSSSELPVPMKEIKPPDAARKDVTSE